MTTTYVIRGGPEGRERLRVLARVMWPTTSALFSRLGVSSSARCLDLGCGGGDVTVELARLVPDGLAIGSDLDDTKLEMARAEAETLGVRNIEFRNDDVMSSPTGDERFELIYARFLLTHLPDPAQAVSAMVERLAPGGAIVVEDIDFTGHFCHPTSAAFWRYVELYTKAVQGRGCDPNIGPRLPSLLREAGLVDRGMNVVQPAGFDGEVKLIAPITLEAIAEAVLAGELASVDDLHQTVDDLYEFANQPDSVLSIPRVVQAWGYRTEH